MRPFITVISGLPRSGTSLMMQMLAAGGMPILTDQLRQADEDNPRGYLEFEPVKRTASDASWLNQAPGKAVKVIYTLLRHLPDSFEYRVILMRRELTEVIASQQAMLEHSGRTGADVAPEQLLEIFRRELQSTEDWLAIQPNLKTLHIQYADCIENPAAAADSVDSFLEAGLNRRRMAAAVDQSLYRRRFPMSQEPPS